MDTLLHDHFHIEHTTLEVDHQGTDLLDIQPLQPDLSAGRNRSAVQLTGSASTGCGYERFATSAIVSSRRAWSVTRPARAWSPRGP